ncbi:hypothetical protein FRC03_008733 [Tulasnella sp. 419]|nr:hypothetical protein FRC03_008733 [Tulasnella sp. 419]
MLNLCRQFLVGKLGQVPIDASRLESPTLCLNEQSFDYTLLSMFFGTSLTVASWDTNADQRTRVTAFLLDALSGFGLVALGSAGYGRAEFRRHFDEDAMHELQGVRTVTRIWILAAIIGRKAAMGSFLLILVVLLGYKVAQYIS